MAYDDLAALTSSASGGGYIWATVDDGGETVTIDGGESGTPVASTVQLHEGDRVQVRIVGGECVADGNVTHPSGDGDAHFWSDSDGAHVSSEEGSTSGSNVLIDTDSVDIRNGTDVLATFGETVRIGSEDDANVTLDSTTFKFTNPETSAGETRGTTSISQDGVYIVSSVYGTTEYKILSIDPEGGMYAEVSANLNGGKITASPYKIAQSKTIVGEGTYSATIEDGSLALSSASNPLKPYTANISAESGISLAVKDTDVFTADMSGNVAASGTITSGGTAVSLDGHTHTASDVTDLTWADAAFATTGSTHTTTIYQDHSRTMAALGMAQLNIWLNITTTAAQTAGTVFCVGTVPTAAKPNARTVLSAAYTGSVSTTSNAQTAFWRAFISTDGKVYLSRNTAISSGTSVSYINIAGFYATA